MQQWSAFPGVPLVYLFYDIVFQVADEGYIVLAGALIGMYGAVAFQVERMLEAPAASVHAFVCANSGVRSRQLVTRLLGFVGLGVGTRFALEVLFIGVGLAGMKERA